MSGHLEVKYRSGLRDANKFDVKLSSDGQVE